MKPSFWIKRFLVVYCGAFVVLLVVGLIKGRSFDRVASECAFWAGVTASVFVVARFYQSKQGQHCALCRDTPEMAQNAESTKQHGRSP